MGRNETCERIITALSSNKAVEIVAPPGYGKTSVVIEVAHRLINRGKLIAYVNPRGVTCVEDLASDIIEALGFVPSEDTITEAIRRIRALKTKSTVLLIENIDNLLHLEAQVRKDERLRELNSKNYCTKMRGKFTKDEFLSFLKDIGKCPTIHLVLTSREFYNFRVSFPTELIDLEPLKDSDSATLFKKCDDSLDEGSINDLVRVCGGIPLIICTVPSILRRENPERFTQRLTSCSPQTLLKLLSPDFQASEDRIDRCLQICFDRFSKENQKIFVMFSTFPKGFTEEQFDACFTSLIGGDLQTFPICLKQSSLLNFDRNKCLYSLHPFIRDFFSSMPEHKEAKSVFLRHYSNLIVSLCKKFLSADKKSAINRYRSEKDNIREAMVWCGDHPELEQTVREHCVAAFNDAAVFLAKMMRKQEFVSLFCKFAYRCQRDRHLLSACLTNIGVKIVLSCTCRPYICPRALYQAKRFLARAKQIHSELTNVNEAIRAHCLSKLGFCCVREGHFGEGYDYLNEAIALRTKREKKSDETKDKVMLGACYNDIAGWEKMIHFLLSSNFIVMEGHSPVRMHHNQSCWPHHISILPKKPLHKLYGASYRKFTSRSISEILVKKNTHIYKKRGQSDNVEPLLNFSSHLLVFRFSFSNGAKETHVRYPNKTLLCASSLRTKSRGASFHGNNTRLDWQQLPRLT